MGDLSLDTAVEGSGGKYRATLSSDWEIWGPNGGYLASVALRAAGAHSKFPRPASFYCQYLAVAEFARVDLEVTTLRVSKRAEAIRVSMTQADKRILEALVWTVTDVEGLEHDTARMPAVPVPEELLPAEKVWANRPPFKFWLNFDVRGAVAPLGFRSQVFPPVPSWKGLPQFLCWYSYRPRATFDDLFVDACRYLILLDTLIWPAATLHHGTNMKYMAPSIDVAVSFHRFAADEPWLLAQAESRLAGGGLVSGNSSVWSRDGKLLASGGQQMLSRLNPFYMEAP